MQAMCWRHFAKGLAVLALLLFAPVAHAQQNTVIPTQVLTIDSERMFAESEFGLRVSEEYATQSRALEAENARIEAELIAEEKELTEKRMTLPTEEFRALAEAFDQKVEAIRQEQNNKSRALTQTREAARRQFIRATQPVLVDIMTETNAAIIVEQRTVLISRLSLDVTGLAIERLNAKIGDGSDMDTPPTPEVEQSTPQAQ